jgi:hypothetical protein
MVDEKLKAKQKTSSLIFLTSLNDASKIILAV